MHFTRFVGPIIRSYNVTHLITCIPPNHSVRMVYLISWLFTCSLFQCVKGHRCALRCEQCGIFGWVCTALENSERSQNDCDDSLKGLYELNNDIVCKLVILNVWNMRKSLAHTHPSTTNNVKEREMRDIMQLDISQCRLGLSFIVFKIKRKTA